MTDHVLHLGDALDVLRTIEAGSVDALVTDPPAGIGFMGKEWDDFRRSRNDADAGRENVFGRTSARGPEYARRGTRIENWNAPEPEARDGAKWAPGTGIGGAVARRRCRKCGRSSWSGTPCVCPEPEWDRPHVDARELFIASMQAVFEECLRVLKPGAHGLVWAIPRTSHWTATALEDAGFEIRDRIAHLFGSGFPKSLNLPGGLGTALKPAVEDWWLVRKPLAGTVAANVEAHGTGALNIDGCRIAGADGNGHWSGDDGSDATSRPGYDGGFTKGGARRAGRWPANLTLDEEAAALLDEQSGDAGAFAPVRGTEPSSKTSKDSGVYGVFAKREAGPFYSDSGGASRFFYTAKPARSERDIGCDDLPAASGGAATDRVDGSAGLNNPRAGAGRSGGARNIHPTVKPVELMRWLCRLITPRGGLVLDPFMGSGTTGVACARESFRFVGIEREPQYMEIAKRRIHGDAPLLNRPEVKTA